MSSNLLLSYTVSSGSLWDFLTTSTISISSLLEFRVSVIENSMQKIINLQFFETATNSQSSGWENCIISIIRQ